MATGHIEVLKQGFRAVVYAGKGPLTSRKTYLKETHPAREAAERARDRLVAQVEAEQIPDRPPPSPTCSTGGSRSPTTS